MHPHAAGAKGGNQDMSRTKGGSIQKYIWPWMRMVCRSERLLLKVPGQDCKEALPLIDGISTEALLADWAYDVDSIITEAISQGMEVVIPPKKNRTKPREYDKALYKLRHLIENAFLYLTPVAYKHFKHK